MTKAGPSYERTYKVRFTGPYSCAALNQSTHPDLPKVGQVHPEDDDAGVSSVKPELDGESTPTDGLALYHVTYQPKPQGEGTGTVHPLDRPPEIEWGGSDLTEVVSKDTTGAPIKNSAGDFYDPLPERPIRGGEVTITRNEASNPAATCVNYSYTMNNATWHTVAKHNALIGKITATIQREEFAGGQITYWKVSYPIRLRRDSWALKLIDNGYRKKVGSTVRSATDDVGNTSPVPVLLNGSGGELPVGGSPVVFPTDGYLVNEETDFGSLNLPNPFA